MTQKINSFFVVDFDRCLGDVDASYNLLKHILNEVSDVDEDEIQSARESVGATGGSFSVLEYILDKDANLDIDIIEKMFIEKARTVRGGLLEPGALKFINFLLNTNRHFCIMSYGEEKWQNLKITASGLGGYSTLIVPHGQKSRFIEKWFDGLTNKYIIPKEYFTDNITREANEIVLIDDKVVAFQDLPVGVRGYLVQGSNPYPENRNGKVSSLVQRITRIDEIITIESARMLD